MAGNNEDGNNVACAVCRFYQRRCDEDCSFAPYFPGEKLVEYKNAHKLFSTSNIMETLNKVDSHDRHEVAETILIEGNARNRDPVHGCLGIVRDLHSQIELYQNQLNQHNDRLAECGAQVMLQRRAARENSTAMIMDSGLPDHHAHAPFLPCHVSHFVFYYRQEKLSLLRKLSYDQKLKPMLGEVAASESFDMESVNRLLELYRNEDPLTSSMNLGESSLVAEGGGAQQPMIDEAAGTKDGPPAARRNESEGSKEKLN